MMLRKLFNRISCAQPFVKCFKVGKSPGGRNCTFRQQWVEDWDISYTRDALRYWVKEGSNAFMAYSIAKCLIKHLHRTVTDVDYRTNERLAGLMLCILRNHAVGDFASEIDGLLNLLNPAFIVRGGYNTSSCFQSSSRPR